MLVIAGSVLGTASVYLFLWAGQSTIENATGLYLHLDVVNINELYLLLCIILGGTIAAILPALRAYYLSLSDGLVMRT